MKNVLIIGLGSAGSRYAKIAQTAGWKVYGYDSLIEDYPVDVQMVENLNSFLGGKADLNLIVLCTPASDHFDSLIDLIGLGIPILCEKPLCETAEEAGTLVQLCIQEEEEQGERVPLWIGYQLRFLPMISKILLTAKRWPILSATAVYYGDKADWHGKPETYQDLLLECSHELDLLLQLYPFLRIDDCFLLRSYCEASGEKPYRWGIKLDWATPHFHKRRLRIVYQEGGESKVLLASMANGDYKHMDAAYQEVFHRVTEEQGVGVCTVQEGRAVVDFIGALKAHKQQEVT